MSIRDRIAKLEHSLGRKNQNSGMMPVLVVPDDFPDPVPPLWHRESEVEKMDFTGCNSVLEFHVPPSAERVEEYKAELRAEEERKQRARSVRKPGKGPKKKGP